MCSIMCWLGPAPPVKVGGCHSYECPLTSRSRSAGPMAAHCPQIPLLFISCSSRNANSSSPEPRVREFEGSNVRVPGCLHCYRTAHAWVPAWLAVKAPKSRSKLPSLLPTPAPRRAPFGSCEGTLVLELSNPHTLEPRAPDLSCMRFLMIS